MHNFKPYKSEKMKHVTLMLLFAVPALSCAAPVCARTPNPEKTQTAEKLDRIERDRDAARLEHNRLLWTCYLDYARSTDRIEDVTKIRAVDMRQLCDTVPALREAQEVYDRAYKRWQQTLRTDSLYREIHDEYVSLKGINDREAANANTRRYNQMYARLAKSNPEYIPARDAKNEARKTRDFMVLDYLVDLYGRQGRILPANDLVDYSTKARLREAYPALSEAEQRLKLLDKLCDELREQFLREQYDVKRHVKEQEKGNGYTGAVR